MQTVAVDDDLIRRTLEITGLGTAREAVEEALQTLVRLKVAEGIRELRGIGWEGDLDAMRRDKPRPEY